MSADITRAIVFIWFAGFCQDFNFWHTKSLLLVLISEKVTVVMTSYLVSSLLKQMALEYWNIHHTRHISYVLFFNFKNSLDHHFSWENEIKIAIRKFIKTCIQRNLYYRNITFSLFFCTSFSIFDSRKRFVFILIRNILEAIRGK